MLALTLAACAQPHDNMIVVDADPTLDAELEKGRWPPKPRPDAGHPDAPTPPPVDSGTGGGGGAGVPGVVSCYLSGNPDATCAKPEHCCFSNYSSQHNGECSSQQCGWGTIDCDGPEDCATGQHCCAHVLVDPEWGITGYKVACQASACGAAPSNEELCHPVSSASGVPACPSARNCLSAYDRADDLPRSLFICR